MGAGVLASPRMSVNSNKFQMARLSALLTLICLLFDKPCQIARPLLQKQNVRFKVGICSENVQLDQIQNSRLSAITT